MTLAEWLFKNRRTITQGDFARKLKISQPYLSRIVNYKLVPSVKLAKEISQATNGQLVWHEIIDDAIGQHKHQATK